MNKAIGCPDNIWGSGDKTTYLRKAFQISGPTDNAWVRIFADTGYELFFNNRFVAMVDEWNNTRDYAVENFLVKGENIIAVKTLNHGGHRGFAFELNVNSTTTVISDGSWKCSNEERWGWKTIEFNDSSWTPARILDLEQSGARQWNGHPGDGEVPQIPNLNGSIFFSGQIPKCVDSPFFSVEKKPENIPAGLIDVVGQEYLESRRLYPAEILKPVKVYEAQAGNGTLKNTDTLIGNAAASVMISAPALHGGPSLIIDFGGETAGFLRLKTSSKDHVYLRLVYGENLSECTHLPPRESLLRQMVTEAAGIESGNQEWESRVRQGFRFVKIEFEDCRSAVELQAVSVRSSIYPVNYAGFFSCSDTLLNKIWENGRRTLHLCMQEYYLDGIKRDRMLWTGDTRLEALINYSVFGDTELFKYCWRKLAEVQYPDGSIPSQNGLAAPMLWDYVAWWLIAFGDYRLHTGDLDFPRSLKSHILRAIDWLAGKSGEDGLIDVPVNRTANWMCVLNKNSGKDLMMNFLFYRSLRAVANLMDDLNDAKLAAHYTALADRTLKSFESLENSPGLTAFSPNYGHFASGSLEGFEVIESFFRRRNPDAALDFIRKNWGCMVTSGYDTLWEAPGEESSNKIDDPEAGFQFVSRCHGWTAGPTYALISEVLGIKPLMPGFRKVEIKPQLGSLNSAKGVIPVPSGFIAVSFRKEAVSFHGTLYIPEHTAANIALPYNTEKFIVRVNGNPVKFTIRDRSAWLEIEQSGVYVIELHDIA